MKKIVPLDLKTHYPRSPKERLGHYVHLARMIDKARAKIAGTIDEYIFPCPLDQMLLDFLGMNGADFSNLVQGKNDLEIVENIQQMSQAPRLEEIEKWNQTFLNREAVDEEGKRRFLKKRNRIAPERSDVVTWVDLLDLDEKRKVPLRKV